MVKNVIFDAGGVIIKYKSTFHPDILSKIFSISSKDAHKFWSEYKGKILAGEISTGEFLEIVNNKLEKNLNPDELYQNWIDAFTDESYRVDDEVIDLIKNLKEKYRVYLLTNILDTTGEHKAHLYVSTFFHKVFRSYDLKLKKPDREIYLHVLKDISSKPQECIFIDDKEENVDAAEKLGIKGILYKNNKQMKQELVENGIEL